PRRDPVREVHLQRSMSLKPGLAAARVNRPASSTASRAMPWRLAANPDVPPRLHRPPTGLQDDAELVRPVLRGSGAPARGVQTDGSLADGLDQTLAVEEADCLDLPRR